MRFSCKGYVLGLASVTLAAGALVIGTAFHLEPVRNETLFSDLLRVGGFSANRHGYNKPHMVFNPTLVSYQRYEGYFDVVVLGDSFTAEPVQSSWANYLGAQGLSVVILPLEPYGDWTVEQFLSSPTFKATPPKVVIYQTAERNLKRRLAPGDSASEAHCDAAGRVPVPSIKLPHASRPRFTLQPVPRPTESSIDDQQVAYARDFLADRLKRLLKRKEDLKVYKFAINKVRFSKRETSSVLVLSGDLDKRDWTPAGLSGMRCQLLRYRDQIHANGTTAFVVLVAPDKLTAYHPDLVDQSLPAGVIDELADPRLVMPRVDRALRKAIEAGEIDVYLPGDSHWGAVGHKIVGDIMVETVTSHEGR